MSKPISGELVRVTWMGHGQEATLEVRHDDGSMTFLVVDVNRMSERVPREGLFPPDGTRRKEAPDAE